MNAVAPAVEDVLAVLAPGIGGGEHPLLHHLVQGWRALRSPGPLFDARRYAAAYREELANEHPAAFEVRQGGAAGHMPRADGSRRGAQSGDSSLDVMTMTVKEGPKGGP